MTSQIFIASYRTDADWLFHALASLKKFSVGFLPPVVGCTPGDHKLLRGVADKAFPEATVIQSPGPGWMGAQIRMMKCDEFCPDADHVFLLGSDCIASAEFRPDNFFHDGKPVMLYNSFAHLLKHSPGVAPWQRGTARVLGFPVEAEHMRRIPTIHPRALYAAVREHVEKLHGMPFDKYIHEGEKTGGGTSETNILGSYAWKHMHDIYHWINLDGGDEHYEKIMRQWPSPIIQFWSKSGLDAHCDRDYKYSGGSTLGKTPRNIIKEIMAAPVAAQTVQTTEPITDLDFETALTAAPVRRPARVVEEDEVPATPRMLVALGISHRDVGLAVNWLRWTSFLCQQGVDCSATTLLIMGTKKVTPHNWKELRQAIIPSDTMFNVEGAILPDEDERGYPLSASHLFLRTMERCEQSHPGCPVLWVEADTVPMRPGWFQEIEAEYAACQKPFLGYLEGVTTVKHMTGVAVYPPNWRELSPKLANVLSAPDDPRLKPWKGQAFDIYASSETVPQMAVSKTIQQIWRPPPFTRGNLSTINKTTALFHQCKSGRLIEVLAGLHYPDYLKLLSKPTRVYITRGHLTKWQSQHESFPVAYTVQRPGYWSVIKPRTVAEQAKLDAVCAPGVLEVVDEEELKIEVEKIARVKKKERMKV